MENFSTFVYPAPVKIGGFLSLWLILWIPIAFFWGGKLSWKLGQPTTAAQKIPLVASLYLLAPLPVWALARIENTSIEDYVRFESGSLSRGMVIGLTGIAVVYGLESLLGWVEWSGSRWPRVLMGVIPLAILTLWLAGTEELIFRGIFFSQLLHDYGVIAGAIISSIIFAIPHLLWEREETSLQLPGLWVMGMILAVAVLVDGGNIGLAWGLHWGWIWGLAVLDSSGIVGYRPHISPWLIGFNGSPIAGLAGILCLLATGLGIWSFQ